MDNMPDEVYVSKQWGGVIGFEPFAGAEKYRRADLPKEVDLQALKEQTCMDVCGGYAPDQGCYECMKICGALDHLVALGVIKDKGAS